MAEIQVTDNAELFPTIPFVVDSSVKIFLDDVNDIYILRDASTNDIIEISPGIEAKFPAKWPPA